MKRFLMLLMLCALLATVALSACDCDGGDPPEEPNPHNISAGYTYGFSLEHGCLIRYDYNEFGQPLGATDVAWDTLLPMRYLGGNETYKIYDSLYEYDREGRLVGHRLYGAEMQIEFDEHGYPRSSWGYSSGDRYSVTYTCNSEGRIILASITKGELPKYATTFTYEYDAKGRPTRVTASKNDYVVTYSYSDGAVKGEEYGEVYTLSFTEDGRPERYKSEDEYLARAEWSYDEASGRCVKFSDPFGMMLSDGYTAPTVCNLSYDEAGRLALVEAHLGTESSNKYYKYDRSYEYGSEGELVRTVETACYAKDEQRKITRIELSGGGVADLTIEYFATGEDGVERPTRRTVNEYDADTGCYVHGYTLYIDADGKEAKSIATTASYDEYCRFIKKSYDTYDRETGELKDRLEYEYAYEGSDLVRHTERTLHDSEYYGGPSSKTSEYVDLVLVREIKEWEITESESGDVYRDVCTTHYNEEGVETRVEDLRFLNGEPFFVDVLTYDLVEGNGIRYVNETTNYEIYNLHHYDKNVKTVFVKTYSDIVAGWTTVKREYSDDVLIYEHDVAYELGWEQIDETSSTLGREVSGEYKYYGANGVLERREVCEYEYHENNYRSRKAVKVYDASGALLREYEERYDEKGQLIP